MEIAKHNKRRSVGLAHVVTLHPFHVPSWHPLKVKNWKWGDVWPSMVTYTRNVCSAYNPFQVHTCCGSLGNSWGFGALLNGLTSVVVLLVDESAVHSLPPPTIVAGPETPTHDLRVTSPTQSIRSQLSNWLGSLDEYQPWDTIKLYVTCLW